MDAVTWLDVVTAATGFFATVTAVVAVVVAIRSDRRSREALKVHTYLELRAGFLAIYRELGRLDEVGEETTELVLARQAYWHHAWDEWYVSKRLAPREFASLWDDFFAQALESGSEHPALWATFESLARDPKAGFGSYAQDLIREVRAMKRDEGTDGTYAS